jgi:hypothetical protein
MRDVSMRSIIVGVSIVAAVAAFSGYQLMQSTASQAQVGPYVAFTLPAAVLQVGVGNSCTSVDAIRITEAGPVVTTSRPCISGRLTRTDGDVTITIEGQGTFTVPISPDGRFSFQPAYDLAGGTFRLLIDGQFVGTFTIRP